MIYAGKGSVRDVRVRESLAYSTIQQVVVGHVVLFITCPPFHPASDRTLYQNMCARLGKFCAGLDGEAPSE